MTGWLILALWISLVTNITDSRTLGEQIDSEQPESLLTLNTSIRDEKYVVENNSPMWRWNLILTYKNVGPKPILLYKKSSLIYRSMISRSLKAASRGRYEQDRSSHFLSVDSLRAAGMLDRPPEEADFVTLKPGDSYTVEADYGMKPTDAVHTGRRSQRGERFIQVRVATWYFYADPEEYRRKWHDKGYLWSQNVTSQPMPFTLK